MNSLGISGYSANILPLSANSIYKSAQVSPLENEQISSDVKNKPTLPINDEINDTATISDEAQALYDLEKNNPQPIEASTAETPSAQSNTAQAKMAQTQGGLTPEQQQAISELKAIDSEVKAHEQAHVAASAGLSVSAPSYSYQMGPDGKKYAVGGEVSISFVQTGDPEKDIAGAEAMKAAALAPVNPSGQDRAVARNADRMIVEMKQQIVEQEDEARKAEALADEADKLSKVEEADGLDKSQNLNMEQEVSIA